MALKLINRAVLALLLGVIAAFAIVISQPETTGWEDQTVFGQESQDETEYFGGWDSDVRVQLFNRDGDRRLLRDIPAEWVAGGEGKTRLLYQDYEKVHGHAYEPRNQGKSPSCVGQAVAGAVDFLAAIEINAFGQSERGPPAQCDASIVYGISRVEIGGKTAGGGSHNLWACQGLQKYGAVAQLNYPLLGIDLREFSAARAIEYGRTGCPDALEPVAQLHPVKDYIAIGSWEELRDAIYYGCPCPVGSPVGFGAKSGAVRDADGFLNPPRRMFFKSVWRHSMLIIAVSDEGRPGALVLNSWGPDWISGPQRYGDEPKGSFWVDKHIIERMIAAGDTYALRGFQGYADYKLWVK